MLDFCGGFRCIRTPSKIHGVMFILLYYYKSDFVWITLSKL